MSALIDEVIKSLKDNFFSNILWDSLLFVLALLVAATGIISYKLFGWHNPKELIKGIRKANRISKEILKYNRPRFNGLPMHLADRFIDIWCTNDNEPLRLGEKEFYRKRFTMNSWLWESAMDEELAERGLIEIDYNKKRIKPIRKWPNDLIYKKCKYFLIKYAGDDKKYYSDMERKIKL